METSRIELSYWLSQVKHVDLINHCILSYSLLKKCNKCKQPVQENQCLERVGHHRLSLPPTVKNLSINYEPNQLDIQEQFIYITAQFVKYKN